MAKHNSPGKLLYYWNKSVLSCYYKRTISKIQYIYKFRRHLRIRYDNQPIQNLQQQNEQIQQEIENQQNEETQQEAELQENNDISDAEEELPRNIVYTQQETPTTNIQQDNNSQQTSEDAQTSEDGHLTSEDEMQTTQTSETYEKQQKIQIQIPQPKNMPLSAKKVFDWWTSPVNNNITHPKYEMTPNRLKECMEHHCSKSVKEECERSCGSRRPKFDFH